MVFFALIMCILSACGPPFALPLVAASALRAGLRASCGMPDEPLKRFIRKPFGWYNRVHPQTFWMCV